jgi:hypothetical protein
MRRLFTALSVLSLVVCAAVLTAWISSIRTERLLNTPNVHLSLYRSGMTVLVDHGKVRSPHFNKTWGIWPYALPGGSGSDDSVWGFSFQQVRNPNDGTKIGVPYWLLLGIFAILPWYRTNAYRREKLKPMPGCRSCGYNLTGNTSGVCPECGTPTVARVKA